MKITLALLAVIGLALSGISLFNHYKETPTEYCSFGEDFNCDVVNHSVYARFLGVPVAAIGLAGYAALLLLTFVRSRVAAALLLLGALIGLGFSLYLTYIEAYVLATWCILCLGSLAVIVGITGLSAVGLWRFSSHSET